MNENLLNELSVAGFNSVKKIVLFAYFANSQELNSKDEAEMTANALINFIRKHKIDLTLDELKETLQEGAYGQYGKVYKVSLNTMIEWILKYTSSQEYLSKVAKRNNRLAIAPKATVTDHEINEFMKSACRKCFETYKQQGVITGNAGGGLYDWLVKRDNRLENYQKFVATAEKSRAKDISIKTWINNPTVVAKSIALKNYFDKFIEK